MWTSWCRMNAYLTFLADNFPTPADMLVWLPPFAAWALGCLWFAGECKRSQQWKTGYTRKLFHVLIFSSAVGVQSVWGLPILCLFGVAASLVIGLAVILGEGHPFYEALAREHDAPRRTYYILVSYCATLIGGVTSNAFFGDAALVGYLITGLGDAVGEPVGTRFGRHRYHVPALRGVAATRSYEGSVAVFLVSWLAVGLVFHVSPAFSGRACSSWGAVGLALMATVLEAIAPHGWDNALLQIIPSWWVAWLC